MAEVDCINTKHRCESKDEPPKLYYVQGNSLDLQKILHKLTENTEFSRFNPEVATTTTKFLSEQKRFLLDMFGPISEYLPYQIT